ncbi:MAG: single-stranded-DNA-specific exonuclease RecJ [Bacteroidota bacterium]|nr:single-stranded-DNA-specific exonuclease RecJ [Bacteroidota bacterium]
MEKRWVLKDKGDPEVVAQLCKELSIDENLVQLLVQRGITNFDEARDFFRPSLSKLHDPFLMKDMDKAIVRIEEACRNRERILIYGDYDVDGTTAVSLVYTFFKELYSDIDYYIPDRDKEGYGISIAGIDYAAENGFTLVIALDCGIKAVSKIEYANDKKVDFIICDHHRPGESIPPAVAVLDPKRADCNYPFKELSGCGVGLKLVQAYALKNDIPFESLSPLLDLVAVSIASDIVPITGENRILSYFGLKLLNSNPRPGLEAILAYCKILRKTPPAKSMNGDTLAFTREMNINDIVFLIGPRINAAGRIESGRNSVKLLVAKTLEEAQVFAATVDANNTERRTMDINTTLEALTSLDSDPLCSSKKSTVIYNPEWHKGVIGIVASRLTESYYRPTIVLTISNGLITGSARSVKDFDVYDAIDACSDLLEHFGGHKYAAGLSMKPENLPEFIRRFEEIVSSTILDEQLIPEIEIDLDIKLSIINSKFLRILNQFAPFGPGNSSPVFRSGKVIDTGNAKVVGKNHLKLSVVHPDITSFPFSAIAFHQGEYIDDIMKGKSFKICYNIEENDFNGSKTIQLNVKDIKMEK